jgi:hypothetical protein
MPLKSAFESTFGNLAEPSFAKAKAPKEFSQLAELHVAGLFAEAGWRVYFPHRDDGFDFIAVMDMGQFGLLIRPVQVKGKYPEEATRDRAIYGFIGKLSQFHEDMVLAIPYFEIGSLPVIRHVAFMPACMIRKHSKGSRCLPAKLIDGVPSPRGNHAKYFDHEGLQRVSKLGWARDVLKESSNDGEL